MKTAFITGVSGQDGSFLSEYLLSKGYKVYGLVRRSTSLEYNKRIKELSKCKNFSSNFQLVLGDLTDASSIFSIISKIKPDEIYNLAAQSDVGISFNNPVYTSDVNSLGTLRILEAIKNLNLSKKTKFYQASSSELYGNSSQKKLNEKSFFDPRSPYAVSKLFSFWITNNYREAYNIYACNGILFNHESHRRGENFVTKKITTGIANICNGKQKCLYLGNINAKRDWGHTKDYVVAQWLILQQKKPKDYVISSGKSYTVKDFINKSFKYLNIKVKWTGKSLNEKCIAIDVPKRFTNNIKKNQIIIKIDKKLFRPLDVHNLLGDNSKALKEIGWKPKYNIDNLISEMIDYDLNQ